MRAAAQAASQPMPAACSHDVDCGVAPAAASSATTGIAWMPCTPSPWDRSRLPCVADVPSRVEAHHDADGERNPHRGDAVADPEPQHGSVGQHVGTEEAQPKQDEQDCVRGRGEAEDDAGDDVDLTAFLSEAGVEAAERLDRFDGEAVDGEHVEGPPPPASPRWAEAGQR